MFQARRETCSGEASRNGRSTPPLEKCFSSARNTITRPARRRRAPIGFVSLVLMIFQCRIRRSRRKNPGLHWRHWEGLGIGSVRVRASWQFRGGSLPGHDVGRFGGGVRLVRCIACDSAAISERPERTAQGYRRFCCRGCSKPFNERSGGILNRTQYPSDVIALVVFWRLRYKLSLRDLPEMFLLRGIEFSHETVREWEAKLTPVLIDHLRRRRGGRIGRSWYVDETYIKVHGRWLKLTRFGGAPHTFAGGFPHGKDPPALLA